MSNVEIEEKMNKVMDDINDEIEREQEELNIKNYDLEDLVERPRVASVPKVNLDLYSHEKKKEENLRKIN